MLQFVRCIQKFKMYVHSQLQIALWLFVLDHINYRRWLTAHISDMINLSTTHPELYRHFLNGNFVVQKNHKVLSEIALDQCNKQVNKHINMIKGDGGAIGLTGKPQALERWMVAGPEISRMVHEFQNSHQTPNKHHKQNPRI